MARKLRVEYPGAIYHVMNRGDHREAIFRDDADRTSFLETLGQVCVKTGWQVHAYCLMSNHFHAVIETPQANLVAGMKWFLGNYTGRFNRKHKLFGHLFSGRYKALVVDGSQTGYLATVCDYVHLNPARAKLLRREQKLGAYASDIDVGVIVDEGTYNQIAERVLLSKSPPIQESILPEILNGKISRFSLGSGFSKDLWNEVYPKTPPGTSKIDFSIIRQGSKLDTQPYLDPIE